MLDGGVRVWMRVFYATETFIRGSMLPIVTNHSKGPGHVREATHLLLQSVVVLLAT